MQTNHHPVRGRKVYIHVQIMREAHEPDLLGLTKSHAQPAQLLQPGEYGVTEKKVAIITVGNTVQVQIEKIIRAY